MRVKYYLYLDILYYKRQVYCLGQVNYFQLGIPELELNYLSVPLKIKFFTEFDVIDFCIGKFNSLFLVSKKLSNDLSKMNCFGEAYGCGLNKYCELGCKVENVFIPIKIIKNNSIRAISCGTNFSLLADYDYILFLLTSKKDNLEFDCFDNQLEENVYMSKIFTEDNKTIKSILAEKKKVSIMTDN